MSDSGSINRAFVCSGYFDPGATVGLQSSNVTGCIATCTGTNPYTWGIVYGPIPLANASDFNELEIHAWVNNGDGSAAAVTTQVRPVSRTTQGFTLAFFTVAGVALATSLVGAWFEVWRRVKQ